MRINWIKFIVSFKWQRIKKVRQVFIAKIIKHDSSALLQRSWKMVFSKKSAFKSHTNFEFYAQIQPMYHYNLSFKFGFWQMNEVDYDDGKMMID